MKILHASMEIAGNMARLCSRQPGAMSVNYWDSFLGSNCDLDLHGDRDEIQKFAERAIDEFDVFHFHYPLGGTLLPDFSDLTRIKDQGKPIVVSYWGSDQRDSNAWIPYQQARFMGLNPPKPHWLTPRHVHANTMINQYADVIYGQEGIPRGLHCPAIVDADEWTIPDRQQRQRLLEHVKDPNKVYFLHAPSNTFKKGSDIICALMEQAKDAGLPVELVLVQGVPHDQVKTHYAIADYAIDQVGVGTFGLFGLEMMCWGIPVLAWQIPLFDRMQRNPPVLPITKDSFLNVVKMCVDWKLFNAGVAYERYGWDCRQWAVRHCDVKAWAGGFMQVYRGLLAGKKIRQLINLPYFQEEYRLLQGEKSEFWAWMIDHALVPANTEYDKRFYV